MYIVHQIREFLSLPWAPSISTQKPQTITFSHSLEMWKLNSSWNVCGMLILLISKLISTYQYPYLILIFHRQVATPLQTLHIEWPRADEISIKFSRNAGYQLPTHFKIFAGNSLKFSLVYLQKGCDACILVKLFWLKNN